MFACIGIASVVKEAKLIFIIVNIYNNCDRISENPPYEINVQYVQCMFLVPQVKICQSPDSVIPMSKNPSSNSYRRLWRLVVSYKAEISLHFDLPSLYSCHVQSPPARGLSRYS